VRVRVSAVTNCAFSRRFFASTSGKLGRCADQRRRRVLRLRPSLAIPLPERDGFEQSWSSFDHVSGQMDMAVIRILIMAPRRSREPGDYGDAPTSFRRQPRFMKQADCFSFRFTLACYKADHATSDWQTEKYHNRKRRTHHGKLARLH
jgi:hypothetical protein